jgi:drug/metabolite transporter (DMT)-like permease
MKRTTERWATAGGLASTAIWSTSIPVSRLVTEDLGVLPATALVLLSAGAVLWTITSARERGSSWMRRLSRKHLAVCGPLFVGYILLLYLAIGMAPTRLDALVAGLANYLWPTMILVFTVIILRRRARPAILLSGIVVSLTGIALAGSVSIGGWAKLATGITQVPLSLAIGLIAAVLWGLYSVLARIFRQTVSSGAVAIFLFAAGLVALLLSLGAWNDAVWSARTVLAALYMALLPNSLAYWLWDVGMRDGDVATLGSISNLIPVSSTLVGTAVLSLAVRWELIGGAVLVMIGAAVSRWAFGRGGKSALAG